MRLTFSTITLLCASVCLGTLFTFSSQAQDFDWSSGSARSAGLGGVYVASSSDALDALAVDPAGLTILRGSNANLAVDAIFSRGSFSNSANQNAPLTTDPGVVPYGAFGTPIGHSRFSFGIGLMPELLSEANWHYYDAPGTAGASYGWQRQRSAIEALRATAGLGVSLGPKLSLGATLGAVYNSNVLQAPYIFQSQPVLAGMKTLLDMHTSGVGWNASVGVLIHPTKRIELGAAWKSRTVINTTGHASGDAYAQFAALGVIAPSNFAYNAQVHNVLPQSVAASAAWQINSRWLIALQANWVNWSDAFIVLPVTLTNGNNAALNSLVGSTAIQDGVPLHWRDQSEFHAGVEHGLTETVAIRAGFSHVSNPVPSSTLTPLTAAIFSNQISTGLSYVHKRSRYEAAYGFRPTSTAHVSQSALLAGEYDNSTVRVGTQSLTLMYSLQF